METDTMTRIHKTALLFLATVFLLSACGQGSGTAFPQLVKAPPTSTATFTPSFTPTQTATPTSTATPIDPAKLGSVERDVTYCSMNGYPDKMDIYYPKTATKPWPAVIIVHGGAWITGDKAGSASLAIQPGLTERGVLVVSINYRLAPDFPWPSMVEDAKCAVRSLRANARQYNIDPDRIGIEGDSVGGQIALLVGLTDTSVGWDVGPYLNYSSQVAAVVDFFGPTDLTDPSLFDLVSRKGRRAFFNLAWNSPELIKASPITYVKKDAPPIFIAHGNLDLTVRFVQSQRFYDEMSALGAPIQLVEMKNGIHSFGSMLDPVSPSYDEVYAMADDFLANQLTSLVVAPTKTPTITPTITPVALTVQAKDISVYCRYGPSLGYSPVGFLDPGNVVPVEATVEDHTWWEIRNPSNPSTTCWVSDSVTLVTGDPNGVPVVSPPGGIAVSAAVGLTPVIHGCGGSSTNIFTGTIATNGPAQVDYHWEVDAYQGGVLETGPDAVLIFDSAGSKAVSSYTFAGGCGTFVVRLIVTYPNRIQGHATYEAR